MASSSVLENNKDNAEKFAFAISFGVAGDPSGPATSRFFLGHSTAHRINARVEEFYRQIVCFSASRPLLKG
jgi:hypothetical protein